MKILKGGLKEDLKDLGRYGTGVGLSALSGLENVAGLLPLGLSALGFKPTGTYGEPLQRLSSQIKEYHGLTPEYLAPQNLPESIAYKFAEKAPLAAALSGPAGLAISGLESLVGGGLQRAGAPELLQSLAELGTGITAGITGVPNVIQKGRILTPGMAQKEAYDITKSLVPKGKEITAAPIVNAIENLEEQLGTNLTKSLGEKLNFAKEKIEGSIRGGKLNPTKAIDLKTSLNELSRDLSKAHAARYVQPLKQSFEDFFSHYAIENPAFYSKLKSAEKLTTLRNTRGIIETFADKLGLNMLPGKVHKPLASILGHSTLGIDKFIKNIATNSEARKYFLRTAKSAFEQSPTLFSKHLMQLSNILDKRQKKERFKILKGSIKAQPSFQVLKGGLK